MAIDIERGSHIKSGGSPMARTIWSGLSAPARLLGIVVLAYRAALAAEAGWWRLKAASGAELKREGIAREDIYVAVRAKFEAVGQRHDANSKVV